MYETLFLHESSTASQEERALAESKMRMLFLESLDKRTGKTDGARAVPHSVPPNHAQSQPRQAEEYADASADNESILGETEKDVPTMSLRIPSQSNNDLYVRGITDLTENSKGDSESDV